MLDLPWCLDFGAFSPCHSTPPQVHSTPKIGDYVPKSLSFPEFLLNRIRMTKWFVIRLLLLTAMATAVVTACGQGTTAGGSMTTAGVLKNDLFTATIDFGTGALSGNRFRLGIRSPAGSYAFTDFSVAPAANLPTPYAIPARTTGNLARPGCRGLNLQLP
jgi:hypothetical protein